jgi:hypothetical protein
MYSRWANRHKSTKLNTLPIGFCKIHEHDADKKMRRFAGSRDLLCVSFVCVHQRHLGDRVCEAKQDHLEFDALLMQVDMNDQRLTHPLSSTRTHTAVPHIPSRPTTSTTPAYNGLARPTQTLPCIRPVASATLAVVRARQITLKCCSVNSVCKEEIHSNARSVNAASAVIFNQPANGGGVMPALVNQISNTTTMTEYKCAAL